MSTTDILYRTPRQPTFSLNVNLLQYNVCFKIHIVCHVGIKCFDFGSFLLEKLMSLCSGAAFDLTDGFTDGFTESAESIHQNIARWSLDDFFTFINGFCINYEKL